MSSSSFNATTTSSSSSSSSSSNTFAASVLAGVAALSHCPFGEAFLSSLSMIWATEIGDKTFFIAALMAMQFSPLHTYGGAMAALTLMTVLSALVGHLFPTLFPAQVINGVAAALFVVFGVKMLREAYLMTPAGEGESEEMREAMEELKIKSEEKQDLEEPQQQQQQQSQGEGDVVKPKGRSYGSVGWILAKCSPVFSQAFTLTFLAEWGDRSQLATVVLGTTMNPYGVIFGATLGHMMCTGLGVYGGQLFARKVSFKAVNYFGGFLFLLFALLSILEMLYGSTSASTSNSTSTSNSLTRTATPTATTAHMVTHSNT